MQWKFVCDFWFHEFLQTGILLKEMNKSKKSKKYSQKPLELCRNLYVFF